MFLKFVSKLEGGGGAGKCDVGCKPGKFPSFGFSNKFLVRFNLFGIPP